MGDFIKLNVIDLLIKIISNWLTKIISIFLIVYSLVLFFWIYGILYDYPIYITLVTHLLFFTISLIFFVFAFYQDFLSLFFKTRTHIGEWKTKKKKLEEAFKNCGGLVGYQPSTEHHIAIIYPSESEHNYPSLEKEGINLLLEHYKKNNIKYILYYCFISDDFLNIIKSEYVTGVHIFGHGRNDSLHYKDGIVQYRELKDTAPKEIVAQWHCNHGGGVSLGVHIGKKYFATEGKRYTIANKRDLKKLIQDESSFWEINEKFT